MPRRSYPTGRARKKERPSPSGRECKHRVAPLRSPPSFRSIPLQTVYDHARSRRSHSISLVSTRCRLLRPLAPILPSVSQPTNYIAPSAASRGSFSASHRATTADAIIDTIYDISNTRQIDRKRRGYSISVRLHFQRSTAPISCALLGK